MLIFTDPYTNNTAILSEIQKAAVHNRDEDMKLHRLLFVEIRFSKENSDMLDFFDITNKNDLPKLFISAIDNRQQQMNKYEFNKDEMNSEFIGDFISDYWNKKLTLYHKSEREPEN